MLIRLWPVLLALGVLAVVWWTGGFDRMAIWAFEGQRDFQNAMARSLRALRGGQQGAFWALMGVCFAYGFFHAVGPGHGKVLIGGYGLGSGRRMGGLAGLALLSSLAQATTAVVFAYGAIWLLEWTREQIVGTTERMMAPVSYALIIGVGLWLMIRGLMRLFRRRAAGGAHVHASTADGTCGHCGHKHGPTIDDMDKVRGLKDAVFLIGAIAIRPCTGALFLLILTWQMGIGVHGVLGAYAMGLGTAFVTVFVAVSAVWFRERSLFSAAGAQGALRIGAGIEVFAGLLIVVVSLRLLLPLM